MTQLRPNSMPATNGTFAMGGVELRKYAKRSLLSTSPTPTQKTANEEKATLLKTER
jgi:hypothetical protein